MKSALFAIALGLGTAAVAQSDMQQPAPAAGQMVAPGNSAPARDARGIPVVSDPAVGPPGFNQPAQPGGTGVPASARPTPQPATENYPVCSRTVTDNCVQGHERGRRGPR
ncbi:hypothetical protein [Sphingosinicella sp.]|uniref:hypothetical protein n=1 Tax=Sphingosinicella sp. TaxID=1917971 RepID=UPI0040380D5B